MKQPHDNQTPLNAPASGETPAAPIGQTAAPKTSGKQPEETAAAPAQEVAPEPQSAEPNEQKSASELLDALKSAQTRLGVNTGKPVMPPVPSSAAPALKSQDVGQPGQAAQPSDIAETVAALVGGQPPKPPGAPGKPKPNKLCFRVDDDMLYAVSAYAIAAGVDESEAARRLIDEGLGKSHIIITPKSPPQLLEFFAGSLKGWSRDFAVIKSRLNAPMPMTDDEELITLVTKWRLIATELQGFVPALIEATHALADLLTGLNVEKIESIRKFYPQLIKWIESRQTSLTKGGLSESEVAGHKSMLENYTVMKSLIEDLGIIKPEDIK